VLRRKAGQSRDALGGVLLKAGNNTAPEATADQREAQRRAELGHIYARAIAWYLPRRYPGTVTVFRTDSTRAHSADLGWRRVADRVDVYDVPGDHLTSITRHVQSLGTLLRTCLEVGVAKTGSGGH
jgi:thioesterase domain-containing protein